MTHQAAADAVGRSRSAASNLLRLLKLAHPVQAMLMDGSIDMGHARALLALEGGAQVAVANKVALDGLSVREAERLVQHKLEPAAKRAPKKTSHSRDILRLQEKVADRLGAKVTIQHGKKGAGKLVVEYQTLDQLESILSIMGVRGD
jgi:ParB family chromosome partitioning protein